jgi:hypothetical protein
MLEPQNRSMRIFLQYPAQFRRPEFRYCNEWQHGPVQVEKPYSRSVRCGLSITHVICYRTQTTYTGNMLRTSTLRYSTTTGSILPAASAGSGLPAASTNGTLPAPTADLHVSTSSSCVQRRVSSSRLQRCFAAGSLLLPTPNGQSAVGRSSRLVPNP